MHSPENKMAFAEWLSSETVVTFQRAKGDPEQLKAAAFLFGSRASESGLSEQVIAEILGVSMARSGLTPDGEETMLDWVETFLPLLKSAQTKSIEASRKPWWKIW